MIYLTMFYIMYLGYSDFYVTYRGKLLEMGNEWVFVLIQYNFVLLHELISNEAARVIIGNIIIALTSLLLAVNLAVIIVASVRPCFRKYYLRYLKRSAIKRHKQLKKEKKLVRRNSV